MSRLTYRSIYAQYRKNPNIRMLVNLWYDGSPTDLLLWENRHFLKRLVLRAIRKLEINPEAARLLFKSHFEMRTVFSDVNPKLLNSFLSFS